MNARNRPQGAAPEESGGSKFTISQAADRITSTGHRDPLQRLRETRRNRRREAAYLVQVEPDPVPEPRSFGLTAAELRAEAKRLQTQFGFQPWEIRARLVDPKQVAA